MEYTALENIQNGQLANLIGIVTMISEPARTRTGGGYQNFFCNVAVLPSRPQIGCVLFISSILVTKVREG